MFKEGFEKRTVIKNKKSRPEPKPQQDPTQASGPRMIDNAGYGDKE